MDYRLLPVVVGSIEAFLIHYTNDFDGVVVDQKKQLKTFPAREQAETFAGSRGWALGEDHEPLDLDALARFCEKPEPLDCPLLYRAWNLFGDACRSLDLEFIGYEDSYLDLHEELFWACGFEGVVSSEAEFTSSELEKLQEVVRSGLDLWSAQVKGCAA